MKNFQNTAAANRFLTGQRQIIGRLEDELRCIPLSESVGENFLKQMDVLIRFGIDLSRNILDFTTDKDVEDLARNVIRSQENARKNLDKIRRNCGQKNHDRENRNYIAQSERILSRMINQMKSAKRENNIGCEYLSALLPFLDASGNLMRTVLRFRISAQLKRTVRNLSIIIQKTLTNAKNVKTRQRCRR